MSEVLRACFLASRDLLRPGMLLQALWPPLASLFVWALVARAIWVPARERLQASFPDWSWLTQGWLADWVANIFLLMGFAPLVYFTTLMLLAAFALPRMMAIVADSDYPDIVRQGRGALWGSIVNTLVAGSLFVIGWLLTLPFILIPGVLLVMPFFWLAWINQRTFRFDALAEHATPPERSRIVREARTPLYMAGGISALLAHVPIVNFLAPAWTALLFVHLCLMRLRLERREGTVVWEQ
ncbi:MAG TPA: EI24 domain-containing protein [Rhodocyclaceae bacterium]|nr:EI24 domain-containing protein [Rhodocyclaceae bacterium]